MIEYHKTYGSDQFDVKAIWATDIRVSADKLKVNVDLKLMQEGYIYELTLSNIQSSDGKPLRNNIICYTLNKLK